MMSGSTTRRLFFEECFAFLLVFTGFTGCKTKEDKERAATNPCTDYSQLSEEDIKKRHSFGYVEKAPTENKHCGNCNLWLPDGEGKPCGRCQLFKGPVTSGAYCTYWAPQI